MSAIPYLYAISGFAVGLLVGMTGVGGGALMTPMLILLFGIHPAAAVGTDLLHAAATKTAGDEMGATVFLGRIGRGPWQRPSLEECRRHAARPFSAPRQ